MQPELERGVELRLKGHLYEIRAINNDVIGGEQGYPMAEAGYHRTLREVADTSSVTELDEVAAEIKQLINDTGDRPPNRKIRRYAREIVAQNGYPSTSYLNRA